MSDSYALMVRPVFGTRRGEGMQVARPDDFERESAQQIYAEQLTAR